MAPRKRSKASPRRRSARSVRHPPKGGFVGRDPSPVLDRYPPRDASGRAGPPPAQLPAPRPAARIAGSPASSATASPGGPLIRLETPFDLDEFSTLLGQTSIRVTVPRSDLPEVLRRVTEFMGFGIYVYSISVRPAANELLHAFEVELDRVEYSAGARGWVPFVERGVADNPFGSGSG
jgi:hypothetical protein